MSGTDYCGSPCHAVDMRLAIQDSVTRGLGPGALLSSLADDSKTDDRVRIPLMTIGHSGGKPITVPEGNQSGVGEATLALRYCQD
jgi:hypothetical protein